MAVLVDRYPKAVRVVTAIDDQYAYHLALKGRHEREACNLATVVRHVAGIVDVTKITYITEATFEVRLDQKMPPNRQYLCWLEPLDVDKITHQPSIPFPKILLGR